MEKELNTNVQPRKLSREEKNRLKILHSARELFIEHGVAFVNMHQIAKEAGVGQATLYRRYKEKGEICVDIIHEECASFFEKVEKYLDETTDLTSLDRLYHVMECFVEFLQPRVPWLCSISRASSDHEPLQSPLYQWMRKICRELMEEAVERNELTEFDVNYTVEILLAALFNIDFHIKQEGFSTEQILNGLQRIFITGLKS
ncbi:TetR/AcrR family transcriptional regulator [Halobacillus salinarum]|uniref:TetR/AcrR family transcriptional regulator n=1 Tax=Halobacillus salinarum TaxID=2932257 RepID=A0ABY4EP23_9BACI|nr:TetR/AcrR family transcriptional regulator [Halobacillus salinarum]UOQ45949.1 TetR/AcrR family transcriptional regulator [Halobacillus salinarum]